jgi:catalase-peroxidase
LHGGFTKRLETLTNDFFINLLDMSTQCQPTLSANDVFEARDRKSGAVKWTGTRIDLVFGSNAQLRAPAEVYASSDAQQKFIEDFVAVWNKVMDGGAAGRADGCVEPACHWRRRHIVRP